MVVAGRRLAAVAVAAQVRHDERVVCGKIGRHLAPFDMRLRVSVQQQQRRSAPAGDDVDRRAAGLDRLPAKPWVKIHSVLADPTRAHIALPARPATRWSKDPPPIPSSASPESRLVPGAARLLLPGTMRARKKS